MNPLLIPIVLYAVLFIIAVFAPLRWSLIAYLILSTIDLGTSTARSDIGAFNVAKGMILPLYLLWRLRDQAGHSEVILAPIAWCGLAVYAGIAASWSLYPMFAIKLVGHMLGSFVICLVFLRATKAGYIHLSSVLPVTIGALAMAIIKTTFMPWFGGETDRFTAFASAQSFAAFLTALYCVALCATSLRLGIRIVLCIALASAVVFDGSRIYILGITIATLLFVLISAAETWIKIYSFALTIILVAVVIAEADTVMRMIARKANSNRIANAITASYQGDTKGTGLGTYRLRRELDRRALDALRQSRVEQILFGHGTSDAVTIVGGLARAPDPNRCLHDEWLRVMYEWGLMGLALWMSFFSSIVLYAVRGYRIDPLGHAKPLLLYLPAFMLGLTGENIIAGAGNDVSVGFLLLIALASVSHRIFARRLAARVFAPSVALISPKLAGLRRREQRRRETWRPSPVEDSTP